MASTGGQRSFEKKVPEIPQQGSLRCSYSQECFFYRAGSTLCSYEPVSCPKWREHVSLTRETSDFSDSVLESPVPTKVMHVVTPYGKFEHDLRHYDFEAVGDGLVVYPLDGSGSSFHYRGSFLYYVE